MASAAVAVGGQLSISLSLARQGCKSVAKSSAVSSASPCGVSASARLGGRPEQLPSRGAALEAKKRFSSIIAKASEQADPSDQADELLKSAQEAWSKVDDKLAIGGLGFAGLILLWASTGLIGAIDKLPLIPDFFEFIGILFSGWFTYRYLLFKPDREELLKIIDEAKGKITGNGSGELGTRDATSSGISRSQQIAETKSGPERFANNGTSAADQNGSVESKEVQELTEKRRVGRDDVIKISTEWEVEDAVVGEWRGFARSETNALKPNGTARPDVSV